LIEWLKIVTSILLLKFDIYHNISLPHRLKRNPHVSAANGVFPSPFPAQKPEKRP